MLCEKYQVNGQTAWSLLKKAERFDLRIVTELDEKTIKQMRLEKINIADIVNAVVNTESTGYIFPNGAKFHIE